MDIEEIFRRLRTLYPMPVFYSRYDPFYVLISTVLSQRTRDDVTCKTTVSLFEHLDGPAAMAEADEEYIQGLIKDVGFYRVKAGRIKEIASIILEEYGGEVPRDEKELLKLPGVGRKTMNCVLSYAFKEDVIAVDTHVHRISNRLGLVQTLFPDETEMALNEIVPQKLWRDVNEVFVRFGQNICRPVSPGCKGCILEDLCPKVGVVRKGGRGEPG